MISIYVFQNDFRIANNYLLLKAIKESTEITFAFVKPIDFEFNDQLGFQMWAGAKKKVFLQALRSLALELENKGFGFLFFDTHLDLKKHLEESKADSVYVSSSPFSYENKILELIPNNIKVINEPNDLLLDLKKIDFDSFMSFTKFRKNVERLDWPLAENIEFKPKSDRPLNENTNYSKFPTTVKEWILIQSLTVEEVNVAFELEGSREFALNHLENYIWTSQFIKTYKKTRNGMIDKNDSSKLSIWLAIGVLSPVEIFNEILKYENQFGSNSSTYWLKLELLWREYFKLMAISCGDLFFMPRGLLEEYIEPELSSENLKLFNCWKDGGTKNSFINANMIELKLTGFMSNRGRQNAASYLVHELNISWLWGAKWFESQLIDFDPASNYGNWQYIAGVGGWGNHKFDYDWQSQTYDPEKIYEKLWLSKFNQNKI